MGSFNFRSLQVLRSRVELAPSTYACQGDTPRPYGSVFNYAPSGTSGAENVSCRLSSTFWSYNATDAARSAIQSWSQLPGGVVYTSTFSGNANIGQSFALGVYDFAGPNGLARRITAQSPPQLFKIDYYSENPAGVAQPPPTTPLIMVRPQTARKIARGAVPFVLGRAVPAVQAGLIAHDLYNRASSRFNEDAPPQNLDAPGVGQGPLYLMLANEGRTDTSSGSPDQPPGGNVFFVENNVIINNMFALMGQDWDNPQLSDLMRWLMRALGRIIDSVLGAMGSSLPGLMDMLNDLISGAAITSAMGALGDFISRMLRDILGMLHDDGDDLLPDPPEESSIDYDRLSDSIHSGVSRALIELPPPSPGLTMVEFAPETRSLFEVQGGYVAPELPANIATACSFGLAGWREPDYTP